MQKWLSRCPFAASFGQCSNYATAVRAVIHLYLAAMFVRGLQFNFPPSATRDVLARRWGRPPSIEQHAYLMLSTLLCVPCVLLLWGCSNYKSNKVAEKVAAAAAAEEADEAEQAALEAAAQQAELESKEATKSLRKRSTCPRQPPVARRRLVLCLRC